LGIYKKERRVWPMSVRLSSAQQTPQRLKAIEVALEEKAPKTYKHLKESGQLMTFVKETDQNLLDSFEAAATEGLQRLPQPQTYLENLQNQTRVLNRAWEEALATWLEFSDPPEEETSESL
jgi:hypothetical protein